MTAHGAGLARYGSPRRGRRPSARCGSRPARPSHPAARVSHARADSVPSCRFPRGEWQCAIATGSRPVNRSHQLPEESRDRRTEHTEASSRRPDPVSPGRPTTPIALPRKPIGRIQVRSGRRSGSRWRPRSPVERHITVQKGHPREADSRRSAQRCRSGERFEGRSCALPPLREPRADHHRLNERHACSRTPDSRNSWDPGDPELTWTQLGEPGIVVMCVVSVFSVFL